MMNRPYARNVKWRSGSGQAFEAANGFYSARVGGQPLPLNLLGYFSLIFVFQFRNVVQMAFCQFAVCVVSCEVLDFKIDFVVQNSAHSCSVDHENPRLLHKGNESVEGRSREQ